MRWTLFIFALLIVFLVQTTALRFIGWPALDLLLALALICGLAAPAPDARLAGFFVGFAQDLDASGPVGLHALALGLAALLLTWLREVVNLQVWWVRWLISFLAGFPAVLLVRLHQRFAQGAAFTWLEMLGSAALTAAVAAVLATIVLGLPTALKHRRRRRRPMPGW